MTTSPSDSGAKELSLREITYRLSGIVHAMLGGRMKVRELVLELRAIADWIDGGTKPAAPAKEEVTTQVELELFQYWVARFNKPRTRFTPERRRVIRARLRDGYTPDDIRRAIDGCKSSAYHNGENDTQTEYNDLTLICRNGTKLEQFRDRAKEHGIAPLPVSENEETTAKVEELTRSSLEALNRGDMNAYSRTEAEIKRLRPGGRNAGQSSGSNGHGRTGTGNE